MHFKLKNNFMYHINGMFISVRKIRDRDEHKNDLVLDYSEIITVKMVG